MNSLRLLTLLLASGAASPVLASTLSAAVAHEAAQAAVDACAHNGYRVTAAVVDEAGLLVAVLRGDDATPHTLDSARAKAYTAVTFGPISGLTKTSEIAARILATPETAQLAYLPGVLLLSGGVAVPAAAAGGRFIAAVGVGGAPGGKFDEECAAAGALKIKERL